MVLGDRNLLREKMLITVSSASKYGIMLSSTQIGLLRCCLLIRIHQNLPVDCWRLVDSSEGAPQSGGLRLDRAGGDAGVAGWGVSRWPDVITGPALLLGAAPTMSGGVV